VGHSAYFLFLTINGSLSSDHCPTVVLGYENALATLALAQRAQVPANLRASLLTTLASYLEAFRCACWSTSANAATSYIAC